MRRIALVVGCAGCAMLSGCNGSSRANNLNAAEAGAADSFLMEGGPFTLNPGDEKYLCYTKTIDRDLSFHSFSIGEHASVHHMFFAQTLAPEEEGPHECPFLFKPTWLPLFTTGRSATKLDLPEGSAFTLPSGTQLVMQLHLLNTGVTPVTDSVDIHVKTMPPADQKYHAALFPFGTTVFDLPPQQQSSVSHDCVMAKDMDAFVMFPHMHLLGKTMSFQVGKDAASLRDIYRGSYDFNNQQLIPQTFSLHQGDFTRMTCEFDNTTSQHVVYGESTHDEMCFFAIFVKDGQSLDGHCVDVSALARTSGDAGAIDAGPPPNCHPAANSLGIGTACTKGGNECATNLACSSDLSAQGGTSGVCISVGKCNHASDCGDGATTCCAPAQGGGAVHICIPESCRPSNCAPVP